MLNHRLWLGLLLATSVLPSVLAADPPPATPTYAQIVTADEPVLYWSFDGATTETIAPHAASSWKQAQPAKSQGKVKFAPSGPATARFPLFAKKNDALELLGDGGRITLTDPGANSPLDFDRGDSLTLEAWVNCTKLGEGQQVYIIGKGRTKNAGVAAENQNYALRLTGQNGQAAVSFLFRSADNRANERNDFHRWNSQTGFAINSGWHYVAVTYTFGQAKSIRGYIDGQPVDGTWDYGGATEEGPVVDNDEVWIGSSMGGNPGSSFVGGLDEIAIYRTTLDAKRIAARWSAIAPKSYVTDEKLLPADGFVVEVFEGVPDKTSWEFPFPEPSEQYFEPALALLEVPHKYTSHGVRGDRSNPFVLRMSGRWRFAAGQQQLLLRSRGAARFYVDGKLVVENKFSNRGGDGHNEIYPVDVQIVPDIRVLPIGDREELVTFQGTGEPQRVTLEIFCGGRGRRPEIGETLLAVIEPSSVPLVPRVKEPVSLVAINAPSPASALRWEAFAAERAAHYAAFNQQRRRAASAEFAKVWEERHATARQQLATSPQPAIPAVKDKAHVQNAIDSFINARLAASNIEPLPLADDAAFLRRVALDLTGRVPPPEMLHGKQSRAQVIDQLLASPEWADHWTSYWQDVLAENPNIINPTLNNTGPFRFWIHESFADNKPFDRFATELILMEGSLNDGGPAGFAMSSQNDAPMAAKAHVIAQAFLGMEMKCARCHDAPYHDFTQKQLFSLAAMLKRGDEQVPKTSTIPGDVNALKSLLVKVTLKPGEKIPPEWPFAKIIDGDDAVDLLQSKTDQRHKLAALVTSPDNHRFGQVIVNRLWQRYLGRGIVDPVDDWEHPEPSHPELLEFLERELVLSGYDLKHVARLILNSHTYQRQIDVAANADRERARLFAGQSRRRLSAEQIVDSLFAVAGKPLHVEELNIDVDSTRNGNSSINLGTPSRAWQFTSMSNERDRPSLSLPAAQTVVDVLEAFGWRSTRPDPLTLRSTETNVLQSAILSNGVLGKRVSQLSDDSAFTELAMREQSVESYVRAVFERVLTRRPTADEEQLFVKLLTPGFEDRLVVDAPRRLPGPPAQTGVAWSNHLKPEASERKQKLKEQLELGDPVTARLAPDWRERAEDLVWTLINSPEFVLVP